MSTVSIRSTTDIARTRNTVHKLLLAQKCSPNLAARSIAAMGILADAVLRVNLGVILDVGVVIGINNRTVELACVLDCISKTAMRVETMQELLKMVVNDVQLSNHN